MDFRINSNKQSTRLKNYPLFILISFVAIAHFFVASAYGEQSLSERLEQAKQAYYLGDLDQAFSELSALQVNGLPEADYYLALIYRRQGKHHSFKSAIPLLQRAASRNHPAAMHEMGMALERGEGITPDLLGALDWYRKANAYEADDHSASQFYKSQDGTLTEQTVRQQIAHLQDAAGNGDHDASYQLAKIYDDGKLVEQDLKQAFHWYRIAAESGHTYSQLMLGYFFCRGIGTPKKPVDANYWFKLSGRKASCNK